MTEAQQDERITRMAAHFMVARNLRDFAKLEPSAARGLIRSADYHIERARMLSSAICSTEGVGAPMVEGDRQAKTA